MIPEDPKLINPSRLCEELIAALDGSGFALLSVESDQNILVGVSLDQDPTPEIITLIGNVIASHEPVSLAEARSAKIAAVESDCETYIAQGTKYTVRKIQALGSILLQAQALGKANRAAYIQQAQTWSIGVMTYCATIEASINAAANVAAVNAITYNIAANTGAVPNVTINGALAISN